MRPYWAFFRTRFLALLQYRAAAIAGIGTQWLFGFVRVMALWAFYQSAGTAQPMAFEQAAAYTWLGQAMLGMLPWNIEREIGESVRTGRWLTSSPARWTCTHVVRALHGAAQRAHAAARSAAIFDFDLSHPRAVWHALWRPGIRGLAGGAPRALLLSSAVTALMNASLFWTVTGDGVIRLGPVLVLIFSGMTVPLKLLPDWAQTFLFFSLLWGWWTGPRKFSRAACRSRACPCSSRCNGAGQPPLSPRGGWFCARA